ncbi:SGNH/GDSL hydrolase family protein [Enterococcus olivae]
MKLYKKDRILFLGDSVTDSHREYGKDASLGQGFTLITAGLLSANFPKAELTFLNRGRNGDRINDILHRIEKDCLDLKPDVLVFLIGINDTWHNQYSDSFGTKDEAVRFKTAYRNFLKKVTKAGITRLLILEPFVLPYPQERMNWRRDLDQKIASIRYLAGEFGCEYLPLDGIFAEKAIEASPEYYAEDGIHPTVAGNGLIAKEIVARMTFTEKTKEE